MWGIVAKAHGRTKFLQLTFNVASLSHTWVKECNVVISAFYLSCCSSFSWSFVFCNITRAGIIICCGTGYPHLTAVR